MIFFSPLFKNFICRLHLEYKLYIKKHICKFSAALYPESVRGFGQ